ncbi:MAG TPA: acyl-CoA dehydrogenase family protein [Gammaproteobacteria bacterium]|nr:acyl-CoA dehydrogenase family protein [Gammaproteobacteria bacterium]
MNFEFSDDQKMLRDQARRFLDSQSPSSEVRRILDGDETYHADLWKGVAEMGWLGTVVPESYGGIEAGYLELCVIAEELGRSLAPIPFSSSVYLCTEALLRLGSEEQKQRVLPGLASGERIGTLAVSEKAGGLAPAAVTARAEDGRISGVKRPVPDATAADLAVVVARTGDAERDLGLFLVELDGDGVSRRELKSIDASRPLGEISLESAPAEPLGEPGQGWDLLESILDRAAVLVAFEQLGGAQASLEMARDYALERYAFGRPIGSFQAIKHRLADMFAVTELARSNCYFGAWALSSDAPELPVAAATARVGACDAFHQCARENIQVHGGMGFTWEADPHLYYRRAKLLDLVLGSPLHWKDVLVSRLEPRAA